MTDNVLAKLREKRSRATAPIREDILVPKSEVIISEPSLVKEEPRTLEIVDNLPPHTDDLMESLQQELGQIPETVRHSGIILEKGIDQRLTRFCKDNKITVETFLEAAWYVSELDPDMTEQILTEAKKRYSLRKRIGSARRLLTNLKKLKS
jgi:hypothetical protein